MFSGKRKQKKTTTKLQHLAVIDSLHLKVELAPEDSMSILINTVFEETTRSHLTTAIKDRQVPSPLLPPVRQSNVFNRLEISHKPYELRNIFFKQ